MARFEPDPALRAAAGALSGGDPIGALSVVGYREDPRALAMRGVAMAQMGEMTRARELLGRAAAAFERHEAHLDRARVLAALAEVSTAERDLASARRSLTDAVALLDRHGDRTNAAWARLVLARLFVLSGELEPAGRLIADVETHARKGAPRIRAALALARAEAAARALKAEEAIARLAEARTFAREAMNRTLLDEVERFGEALNAPVARLVSEDRSLTVADMEVMRSRAVIVDGIGRRLISRRGDVDLRTRPVLFELLAELARAGESGATAEQLIRAAFGAQRVNESHRARLRVAVGRLRRIVKAHAEIVAVEGSWRLESVQLPFVLIEPLGEPQFAQLRALLSDGAAWSVKSLARALDQSERATQRSMRALLERGGAEAIGRGRARRYALRTAGAEVATQMLLLALVDPV